jgi:hypothetical protein
VRISVLDPELAQRRFGFQSRNVATGTATKGSAGEAADARKTDDLVILGK